MIYKVKITYAVTNLEWVPSSCIINKKLKKKTCFNHVTDYWHINKLICH